MRTCDCCGRVCDDLVVKESEYGNRTTVGGFCRECASEHDGEVLWGFSVIDIEGDVHHAQEE